MTSPAAQLLARFAENRFNDEASYTRRPDDWVHERVHEFTWSKQAEILNSLRDNRYTAVHSAHETGKTFIASRAITWWIDTHPVGEAFVVSTAPSAAQVSAVMWREVGKVHSKAELPGRILTAGYPQWKIGGELIGYGRKPADYEDSAFQGIHARYVLVVIDEAGGVPKTLYNAIDSIVANENSRVLAIGNPDDPGSHFAAICKPGSDWTVIHLDGLRTPNMSRERVVGTDPAKPRYPLTAALLEAEGIPYSTEEIPYLLRELLIDPLWIEERIRRWGGVPADSHLNLAPDELGELVRRRCATSPIFQAKVRGIFPDSTSNGVIPLGWAQQAMNRWKDWMDSTGGDTSKVADPTRHVVGIDVAREGEDETVMAPRYGNVCTKLTRYRIADTMETADVAAATLHESQSMAVVDVIGIGAGVFDALRRMKTENRIQATIVPFNAAAQSTRTDKIGQFRFRNDRSAAWWKFRELLDPSRGSNICLPDDERLLEELCAPKYTHNVGGIIVVESKEDIRKRLGRSTDSADAVIQAWWVDGLIVHDTGDGSFAYENRQPGESNPYSYTGHESFTPEDLVVSPGMGGGMGTRLAPATNLGPFAGSVFTNSTDWDL